MNLEVLLQSSGGQWENLGDHYADDPSRLLQRMFPNSAIVYVPNDSSYRVVIDNKIRTVAVRHADDGHTFDE